MENMLVNNQISDGEVIEFSKEQKTAIINEALLGSKSLSEILIEHSVTEKEFYLWMSKSIKK